MEGSRSGQDTFKSRYSQNIRIVDQPLSQRLGRQPLNKGMGFDVLVISQCISTFERSEIPEGQRSRHDNPDEPGTG